VIVYLDTSIVLRILLGQPRRLALWGKWDEAFTSEIMGLEARRALDRLRLASALDDEDVATLQGELARIENTIGTISLTRTVLHRASLPMATPVKTLDAIHLASALLLHEHHPEALLFATHDARQSVAARALGFECLGV
jgi:predicted nucleic acid-binding protein